MVTLGQSANLNQFDIRDDLADLWHSAVRPLPDWVSADRVPDWAIPTVPRGYDAWEGFFLIFVLALFKIDRARIMQRNADYIDRFGWSIIIFDVVFGVVFLVAGIYVLYPGLHTIWWDRFATHALMIAALWQWLEIRLADRQRIERAIGTDEQNGGHFGEKRSTNGVERENYYRGAERRHAYRRQEDRVLRGLE